MAIIQRTSSPGLALARCDDLILQVSWSSKNGWHHQNTGVFWIHRMDQICFWKTEHDWNHQPETSVILYIFPYQWVRTVVTSRLWSTKINSSVQWKFPWPSHSKCFFVLTDVVIPIVIHTFWNTSLNWFPAISGESGGNLLDLPQFQVCWPHGLLPISDHSSRP